LLAVVLVDNIAVLEVEQVVIELLAMAQVLLEVRLYQI
jgi:hypothetical protein